MIQPKCVPGDKHVSSLLLWVFFACFCLPLSAAEIYTTSTLTLTPAYGPGSCARGTSNGYTGFARQGFTATVAGYYSVKDFSWDEWWAITSKSGYDPNGTLVSQALASNPAPESTAPTQVYLSVGDEVYVWVFWNGGYGGSVTACETNPHSVTVTLRIAADDSGVPAPPMGLSASSSGEISFTPGSSNGSAITNYQFGLEDPVLEEWVFTALSPADYASPISIPGLSEGASVEIRLKAVNANGAGWSSEPVTFAYSAASSVVVPVPLPLWLWWLLSGVIIALGCKALSLLQRP